MFNQNQKRIGFACKIQSSESTDVASCQTKGTTITWLTKQPKDLAAERLWNLMRTNIQALENQADWMAQQPPELRMFRLSSDLLTAYSHDDWMWFYFQSDVVDFLEKNLSRIGDKFRAADVRVSFHPGQFCVLASDNPGVVENSITEFEYHADLIRYMGYGRKFQDFKCNVHVGGKQGPSGIITALRRLTPEARNCLTIENAEFTWGIDASLELVEHCALVLDIHHHWIHTGEYINPTDHKFERVIDSWHGVRPVIHYSVSREDVLVDHDSNVRPNLRELKSLGFTAAKLRAHSEYYWNQDVNQWAGSFLDYADIMCESKQKNTASYQFAKEIGHI
jgi:UV DNA damage repair endonuclease